MSIRSLQWKLKDKQHKEQSSYESFDFLYSIYARQFVCFIFTYSWFYTDKRLITLDTVSRINRAAWNFCKFNFADCRFFAFSANLDFRLYRCKKIFADLCKYQACFSRTCLKMATRFLQLREQQPLQCAINLNSWKSNLKKTQALSGIRTHDLAIPLQCMKIWFSYIFIFISSGISRTHNWPSIHMAW